MGQTIVVTGASRGIGRAIVEHFAARDSSHRFILLSRTYPDELRGKPAVSHHSCDLGTEAGIESAIKFIKNSTDQIQLLVNNAGQLLPDEAFATASYADFHRSFTLHATAHFILARECSPLFNKGSDNLIVNIGSIYGNIADPYAVAYVASKACVPIITQLLARELAPDVRVNAILPGHVDTPMTANAPTEYLQDVISKTPVGRLGSATEVASLVEFLWSAEARFITGSIIRIDGGFWNTAP